MTKPRKNKISDRREEIVSSATDLFYEYGYQKATMRDICGRIGITQAALYYHFRNKEEILYTIIERSSNDLYFTLKSCFSGKKDAVEELRDAILQHILLLKEGRKGAKIIIEDKRFLSGELNKLVKEKEMAIFHFYRKQLEQLQKMKRVKEGDLTVATFGILAMINWLYHWYRPEKALSIKEIGERVVELLFYGFLTKER